MVSFYLLSIFFCGVVQGMELRNFRRGRHLYSTGRPSRWASVHILVMAALRNSAVHYVFALWFLFSLFSFFRLIAAAAHWMSTILRHMVCPSANLECRSETCCARLAGNAGPKNSPKVAIWASSHNFVGLYLRN